MSEVIVEIIAYLPEQLGTLSCNHTGKLQGIGLMLDIVEEHLFK